MPKVNLFFSILKVTKLKIISVILMKISSVTDVQLYCFLLIPEHEEIEMDRGAIIARIYRMKMTKRTQGCALWKLAT